MSDTEVTTSDGCGCEAKFADMTRALELQAERIAELTTAVNTTGQQVQAVMDMAAQAFEKFKDMSPGSLLKGMLRG